MMKKKSSFVTVVLLVVAAVYCIYSGFGKSAISSAKAQNVESRDKAPAVQMLINGLNESDDEKGHLLFLCALSRMSEQPDLIRDGWNELEAYLKSPQQSELPLEEQIELISVFQKGAALDALLASPTPKTFDSVWETNQSIIKTRDRLIIKKLNGVVSELVKMVEGNDILYFDSARPFAGSIVNNNVTAKIYELIDISVITSDIPDGSQELIEVIKDSQEKCKVIAEKLSKQLEDKCVLLTTRLKVGKAKDVSDSGNMTFIPEYDRTAQKWRNGEYYLLINDVQALLDTVQLPVVDRLLTLLEESQSDVQQADNSERQNNYALKLQVMQKEITERMQIRYNLYANAIILNCSEADIDNSERMDAINDLNRLDMGLLFPLVSNEVSSFIGKTLNPENRISSESRAEIIEGSFLDEKIPLTAF